MENNDNKKRLSNLQSAEELRGKKSGSTAGKGGKKKLWLSVILLAVVLAAAFGVYYLSGQIKPEGEEPQATQAPDNTVKVVSRDMNDVDRLTVEKRGGESYTLIYTKNRTEDELKALIAENTPEGEEPAAADSVGTGILAGNSAYPMNDTNVSSILSYAANMTASSLVESNAQDLAKYGLTDPAIKVTMTYLDGTSETWCFGDPVPASTGYYMALQGGKDVYHIYSRPVDLFSKSRLDLHVVSFAAPFSANTEIQDFVITPAEGDAVEIRYLAEGESTVSISSLVMVQPFRYDVNSERATEIMDGIMGLAIKSYAGEVSELPEAGLDAPRYTIFATDNADKSLTVKVGAYCGSDQVYVQVDDTNAVYLADASTLAFLDNVKPGYLVDQFSNLVYIIRVDGVEITCKDAKYTLGITREPVLDADGNQKTAKNGQPETSDTYFFDGEEIAEDDFKSLYQTIIGMQVSKLNDDYYYDGDVALTVHYTLNTEPGEFTVEYLEYDSDYYAVRRNGVSLFLIKRNKVDNMIDALKAFAEK